MLNAILSIFKSKAAKLNDAAKDGDIAKIERLLNKGADPDGKKPKGETEGGFTPLHFAAVLGHADAIITLLNAGADLNARDQSGNTPLHGAARSGRPEAITALLDAGAHPNAKDNDGDTALDWITEDSPIHGTDAYWRLNDAKYNQ